MRGDANASPMADPLLESVAAADSLPLDEETFRRMIAIERKRTERSKAPFLLMLLEITSRESPEKDQITLQTIVSALHVIQQGH